MAYKNKIYFLLLIVFISWGCAGVKTKAAHQSPTPTQQAQAHMPLESKSLQNIENKDMQAYVQKHGVIFGKTDFQGVLKTVYVKLLMQDQSDPDKQFQLFIAVPANVRNDSSDVKPVSPGYFFIELPVGKYHIKSVSIPVGATLATEDIDVSFVVSPDAITYIGTLKIDGTKEKIKLGGVPVIKPGFEYKLDIMDEQQEALETFHQKYPMVKRDIEVHLMQRLP